MSEAEDSDRNRSPPAPESVVEVRKLRKEFGELVAVRGADFEVRDGEFFSIIGPSGSGKTTLLRMIAGFEEPTAGTIRLEGRECTYDKPYHRNTNMIFQNLALLPHLDVEENIAYGLVEAGIEREKRKRLVGEMLSIVDLEGYQSRSIDELSGGEQQRVALARGLVNEPSVLLLDEPLASLDERLKEQMKVELKRIQDRTNTTFIYVTHDQEVAMAMSDRIAILRRGEIQQIAPPEDMYSRPANAFVAEFTGAENIFDVDIQSRDGDRATVELGSYSFPARLSDGVRQYPESTARLVIRPEDISALSEGGKVHGVITDLVYKGALIDVITTIEIGNGELQVQAEVHSESIMDFEEGDEVALDWSDEKALLVIER